MGYTEKWKVLEDLMLALRKKGYDATPNVINDLRSAKMMIKIADAGVSTGDVALKLEEILGIVESQLITQTEIAMSSEEVDEWLKRLDEASLPTYEAKGESESTIITGIPRDQKWIRVEPMPNLSAEKLTVIAKENSLSVNRQKDGRLVVYGQQEGIKTFLKQMAELAQLKIKKLQCPRPIRLFVSICFLRKVRYCPTVIAVVKLKGFQKLTLTDKALQTWLETLQIGKPKVEALSLEDALGRILAEDFFATESLPRFDKSAMDGYALNSADSTGASQSKPAVFLLADDQEIGPKQAKPIWTGNPIPKGADAV